MQRLNFWSEVKSCYMKLTESPSSRRKDELSLISVMKIKPTETDVDTNLRHDSILQYY